MLTSRIVGGIFADYDFASNVSTDATFGPFSVSVEQKNTLSIGARLGVLSSPTTLWYGTAGYTQTEFDLKGISFSLPDFKGYFVGAGVESQLVGGWNLRAEYRFSQFDSESVFDGLQRRAVHAFGSRRADLQVGSRGRCSRSRADEVVGVAPAFRLLGRSSRSGPFSCCGGLCGARVDAVAMPGRPPSPIRGSRPGHPDATRRRAAAAD